MSTNKQVVTVQVYHGDAMVAEMPAGKNVCRIDTAMWQGMMLTLRVTVIEPPSNFTFGLKVDWKTYAVSEVPITRRTTTEVVYETVMELKRGMALYPDTAANLIRLLMVNDHGAVMMNNIAVVSQNGKFFLTRQVMFAEEAFLGTEGQVVIPRLKSVPLWAPIGVWLEAELIKRNAKNGMTLRPVSDYVEDLTELGDGAVKWYSWHQGIGVVMTNQGLARIHYSQIPAGPDGFRGINETDCLESYQVVPREQKPGHVYTDDIKIEVKRVVVAPKAAPTLVVA